MENFTPSDPLEDILQDMNDLIKSFPNGLLITYNREFDRVECSWGELKSQSTYSDNIFSLIYSAANYICPKCDSVNTVFDEGVWVNDSSLTCNDCNHIKYF